MSLASAASKRHPWSDYAETNLSACDALDCRARPTLHPSALTLADTSSRLHREYGTTWVRRIGRHDCALANPESFCFTRSFRRALK